MNNKIYIFGILFQINYFYSYFLSTYIINVKYEYDKENSLLVNFFILIEVKLKFIDYFNEWLIIKGSYINYEAGFIRRGLFGSILFFLANNTPIEPFKFQLIFIILLVIIIIKEFYINKLEPYILFGSFMLINVIAYKMFFTLDVLLIVYFLLQLYY